ncbi:MAG: RidA family protein [Gammaproteobacteria bacterium]
MSRLTSYPEGHWSLKVGIPYSMGVKQGGLIFLSGQADLKGEGEVCNPGDLRKQTAAAIEHIRRLFADLQSDIEKLVKLTVFYVNDGNVDQDLYKAEIARLLGTSNAPVIVMVPLSRLFYPGAVVEVDAVGIDSDAQRQYVADPQFGPVTAGLSQALRCGEHVFVGSTTAAHAGGRASCAGDSVKQTQVILERLESILHELGADRGDVVKINNWFVIEGTAEAWARSAEVRAGFYADPGPVATGMPLHYLGAEGLNASTDCWAMRGEAGQILPKQHAWPAGHWDWPIHLPFKHGLECGSIIFLGGQVSLDASANVIYPNNLPAQTRTSMDNVGKVLAELGAGFPDILKLNTWYQGAGDPQTDADTLHTSVNIRSSYFHKPGPASTGIPLDRLCFERMVTETEAIAFKQFR